MSSSKRIKKDHHGADVDDDDADRVNRSSRVRVADSRDRAVGNSRSRDRAVGNSRDRDVRSRRHHHHHQHHGDDDDYNRKLSKTPEKLPWNKHIRNSYDPIRVGSIDGTDTEPHDRGITRAINSKYTPNERVMGNSEKTIFVAKLHRKTDEKTLEKAFSRCGPIRRCRIIYDLVTGTSKCYGFIEFESRTDAKYAIRKFNNVKVDNCEVVVEPEMDRSVKDWKPRRLGGGLGGRKESGQLRFGGRSRPFQEPISYRNQQQPPPPPPLSGHHQSNYRKEHHYDNKSITNDNYRDKYNNHRDKSTTNNDHYTEKYNNNHHHHRDGSRSRRVSSH